MCVVKGRLVSPALLGDDFPQPFGWTVFFWASDFLLTVARMASQSINDKSSQIELLSCVVIREGRCVQRVATFEVRTRFMFVSFN